MSVTEQSTCLSLDGGATRVVSQLFILEEMMHRLAWDLRYFRDGVPASETPQVLPANCFDHINAAGTGSIIALLLAARRTASQAREDFIRLAEWIRPDGLGDLKVLLESLLVEEAIVFEDEYIIDQRCATNIWIDGKCIEKGTPIKQKLVPLVLAEIEKELSRDAPEYFNTTQTFISKVCPNVSSDCKFLLSIGSGLPQTAYNNRYPKAPRPGQPNRSPCSIVSQSIPGKAHSRIYFRLNPILVRKADGGNVNTLGIKDWETKQFGTHKTHTISYYEKGEVTDMLDRIVEVLARRPLPPPQSIYPSADEYDDTDYR